MSFHLREYVYSRIHDVEAVLQALNLLPCGLYSPPSSFISARKGNNWGPQRAFESTGLRTLFPAGGSVTGTDPRHPSAKSNAVFGIRVANHTAEFGEFGAKNAAQNAEYFL
jgi:hypothetical protein